MGPRRLNVRLLLWTLAGIAVLAVAANLLHGYQVRGNASYLYERGREALAKKDPEQALHFLGQYLKLAPADLDAREKYDLTLDETAADTAQQIRVILRLEELVMRDPTRDQARLRLVYNLIDLDRYKDALVHLKTLMARRPDVAELEHLLGWCQAAGGDAAGAVQTLARAVERAPRRIALYRLWAEILTQKLSDEEQATKVMDRMVAANPKCHEAYLVHSSFAKQSGQLSQAKQDLKQALTLAPDDAGVLLAAAQWSQSEERFDEARTYLQRGLDLYPGNGALRTALADLELRAGRRDQAIGVLRAGEARAPQPLDAQVRLIDMLIDAKKYSEAEKRIEDLNRTGADAGLSNYFAGRLAAAQGNWEEAISLLEKARADLGAKSEWSSRVHAVLGVAYEAVGDDDRRLAALREAVRIEPGWMLAKQNLGSALLAAGQVEEAYAELEAVSRSQDAPPAVWPELARAQLALAIRRPETQRDWQPLEKTLAKLAATKSQAPELTILRAGMLAARRQFADAEALLAKARTDEKKSVVFWTAEADLYGQQRRFAEAFSLLDQAAGLFPSDLGVYRERVRLCSLRGNDSDRAALRQMSQEFEKLAPEQRVPMLRATAQAWQALGDTAAAVAIWQTLARMQPRDVQTRFRLMEAALDRGDTDAGRELLAELRRLEGDAGNCWRWGAAALQISKAQGVPEKLIAARATVRELGRRQPEWSRVPLLEARLDELEGKWEDVIAHGAKAVELGEDNPALVRRLADLMLARRMFALLDHVLLLQENVRPLSPDLVRHAAEAAAFNKNRGRLHALLAQLYPSPPRDYRELVWLGGLLDRIGESTKAEDYLRRAVQQADHAPDAWAALVDHLARAGQHPAAEAAIAQMQAKMPARRLPLALARCWDAAGDPARAEKAYAAALAAPAADSQTLAAAADFYRRLEQPQRAAPLYERLLDPRSAAPHDVQAEARRQLALMRISESRTQAEALLDANRHVLGDQPADRRIRWFLEGADSTRRKQAIRRLKESFEREPSVIEEEMLLVQLLEENKEPIAARDRLARVLAFQQTPSWIARHVRLLVKTNAVEEAAVWLAKLERWEPASSRTREMKQLVAEAKSKV